MIPRFYYTFPFYFYIKALFHNGSNTSTGIYERKMFGMPFYYTNNARTGLRVLLSSISHEKLRVGVQVFTCHTVFQAIKNAGHDIVFLDITSDFKLDLEFLNSKKEQIDVLIITHTFGFPDRYDEIKQIIGDKVIIEDCAHAYFSKYNGHFCGTLGDASVFSFGLGKFPPIGFGGGVLLNCSEKFPLFIDTYNSLKKESLIRGLIDWSKMVVYSIVLHRPIYGLITRRLVKLLDKKMDFVNKFGFKESQGNFMGLKLLDYSYLLTINLLEINKRNLNTFYSKYKLVKYNISEDTNGYVCPLLLENRDVIYWRMINRGVEVGRHFSQSIIWAKEFGYQNTCSSTELICNQILSIPLHKAVSVFEINKIVNVLTETTDK